MNKVLSDGNRRVPENGSPINGRRRMRQRQSEVENGAIDGRMAEVYKYLHRERPQ